MNKTPLTWTRHTTNFNKYTGYKCFTLLTRQSFMKEVPVLQRLQICTCSKLSNDN